MHSNRFQDTGAVKNGPRNVKTTLLKPLIDNLLYPTKAKGTKNKLDNRLLASQVVSLATVFCLSRNALFFWGSVA